ncbi:MAG: ribonuclease P protein component [Chloroflexi bacterium AL-W]|nr:ribonuclease P protein component [Chloroflexi bacterium AL-N1]NOK64582.1 ribonuclease P protein component [Chloroflexi bacterium AL-N10]NOK75824.1 ribonuclease P protein component [Chloroflexi bacterium AL-N5]NOK80417.1 ribonuclease P protein component [Chloroflexi bacterium AL-W]NOK86931.1 ribonuclease P protein component [Chloroflexi bacterium AL-N15]
MKRVYRLRRPDQFQRVRRGGRGWEHPLFVLRVAPTRRHTTRCGFVVGKRLGSAVVRNRAKRRVREAVRLVYHHIKPGWDVVFVIRSPATATIAFINIQDAVENVLQQAGLWHNIPESTK